LIYHSPNSSPQGEEEVDLSLTLFFSSGGEEVDLSLT